MTALVIIITGVYEPTTFTTDPIEQDVLQNYIDGDKGGALTSAAMKSVIPWFPYVLSVAVFLFAFSTMISSLIDNFIFSIFAWIIFNPNPLDFNTVLFTFILGTYVLRIFIAIVDTPFIYIARYFLPRNNEKF